MKLNFSVFHFTIVCALKCGGNINFGSSSTIECIVSGFDRVYINISVVESIFFMLRSLCVICVSWIFIEKVIDFLLVINNIVLN